VGGGSQGSGQGKGECEAVNRALDHTRIAEGPGGSIEMVPGQHHVRMNMNMNIA
jgi:branched-chain amino acid transport system substrate-binding protein